MGVHHRLAIALTGSAVRLGWEGMLLLRARSELLRELLREGADWHYCLLVDIA